MECVPGWIGEAQTIRQSFYIYSGEELTKALCKGCSWNYKDLAVKDIQGEGSQLVNLASYTSSTPENRYEQDSPN